jgi:hypothetical protein
MVAATALKLWSLSHLQWHDLPTEFHKNLPIGSEVYSGDRQTHGMVISLAHIFPLGRKVGYEGVYCYCINWWDSLRNFSLMGGVWQRGETEERENMSDKATTSLDQFRSFLHRRPTRRHCLMISERNFNCELHYMRPAKLNCCHSRVRIPNFW